MALTDTAARNTKWSGKTSGDKVRDGDGMYLLVKEAGKYWRMDYRYGGKRKTLALGVYPAIGLGDARRARDRARALLRDGIDPSLHRKAEKLQQAATQENSFQSIGNRWYEQWHVGKAASTANVIRKRLDRDVYPYIGPIPVADVTAPMLIGLVKKVEERGALDVASRVLNTCGQVFRFAVTHGLTGSNPATFIKPSDILPTRKVQHHVRLSAKDLPDLLRAMHAYDGSLLTRYAMQLMALTFVRTGELIGARWEEIDMQGQRWVIPAERMKMQTEHIVPLSVQAVEVLQAIYGISSRSPWVFPHESNPRKHMSNNTILFALYRMGYKGRMTGHGFRGVASTILHERGFEHAHIELQLAHMERNEVSAAYNYATYLEPRGKMMQWWADYLGNLMRGADASSLHRTA